MNRHSCYPGPLVRLCCALTLGAFLTLTQARGQTEQEREAVKVPENNQQEDTPAGAVSEVTERDYQDLITRIESSDGAYGADLSEALLSMGLAMQSQGRHEEAIALFKRGIHLSRVNEGLYSGAQVPLLQAEIASHIAAQDYSMVDERQRYLYRVQTRGMASGRPLTTAYMQQALWQYQAFRLGLGGQGYTRLMNMWDFYRLALNDVILREGDNSPELLPPLYGMLQTQYLISGYQWQEEDHDASDDVRARQNLHRFTAYQSQSYRKGNAVIASIHGIEEQREDGAMAATEALVMLGDWRLWHGDHEAALETYREAQMELAQLADAQTDTARIFGEPVALPDINGLRPLPFVADPDGADILLEFGVSDRGRVLNLERLDETEGHDGKVNRLMRQLRKTKFRPRFEAGQAVETENIVKALNIQ